MESAVDDACPCGSGQIRWPLKDGYNLFLTFVCDHCVGEKRQEFRADIFGAYDHDEPMDDD